MRVIKTNPLFVPFAVIKRIACADFMHHYAQSLLTETNGNIAAAARMAGLDRSNFKRLLKPLKRREAE